MLPLGDGHHRHCCRVAERGNGGSGGNHALPGTWSGPARLGVPGSRGAPTLRMPSSTRSCRSSSPRGAPRGDRLSGEDSCGPGISVAEAVKRMIHKSASLSENARTRWLDERAACGDAAVGARSRVAIRPGSCERPTPLGLPRRSRAERSSVTGASSGIGRAVALKAAGSRRARRAGRALRRIACAAEGEIRAPRQAALVSYAADLSSTASTNELLSQLAAGGVGMTCYQQRRPQHFAAPSRIAAADARLRAHDGPELLRLGPAVSPSCRTCALASTATSSTFPSAGAQMSTPMFSAYVASKAALDAFTRVAASESPCDGVRFHHRLHAPWSGRR